MSYLQFKSGWQCPCILKNGFSTLANIVIYENTGDILEKNYSVWNKLEELKLFKNKEKDLKTFFVWRNPYDRFVSLYKDFVTNRSGHDRIINITSTFTYDNIEHKIPEYTVEMLNLSSFNKDSHVNKQAYELFMNKICGEKYFDYLVKIEDLLKFVNDELGHDIKIFMNNVSNKDIDITTFEKYRPLIDDFYKCDYDLLEKYKDKIYK